VLFASGKRWKLYHGDLYEVATKFIPDNSIDFIITDPPYSWSQFKDEYFKLASVVIRVLKDGGIALLFIGSHSLDKKMELFSSVGLQYLWCFKCTWKPLQGTPKVFRPVPVFVASRLLLAYGKGDLNKILERWNRKSAPIDLLEVERIENERRWIVGDVIVGEAKLDKSAHKWQQNLNLFVKIAQMFVCEGDIVLDPFNGTGTTGVGVLIEGGNYIGIDIDGDVLKKSVERLSKVEDYLERRIPFNEQTLSLFH